MSERKRRTSCPENIQAKSTEKSMGSYVPRPNKSYTNILVEILSESEERRMFLSEIYNEMAKRYPFFSSAGKSWKNSVRHNLSQNSVFVKIPTAGRCNMWGLAEGFRFRFCNGRLVNVNKADSAARRRFTLPEVKNLIEITSNPKLILPRLNRPIPESFYLHPLQPEIDLETPPWIETPSDNSSSLITNIIDFPSGVEMLCQIDKENDFTPAVLLPKVPIYPFFSQSQTLLDSNASASNYKKKLSRNRDPLLSNSLYSENQSHH